MSRRAAGTCGSCAPRRQPTIALDDGPPINFCKPAVDPLFSSAAEVWGAARWRWFSPAWAPTAPHGAADIVAAGGSVIAQDEATSVVWGMPRLGRAGRAVLGGAAARPDRAEDRSPVCRGPVVTPLDYDYLRKLLKERSGLVLSADKQYLVESRLLPVARRAGLAGLAELVRKLKRRGRRTR